MPEFQRPLDPRAGFVAVVDAERAIANAREARSGGITLWASSASEPSELCTLPLDRIVAVLGFPGLTHAQKLVLITIATYDGPGGAFPSQREIGQRCTMAQRTVREHVSSLVKAGAVTVQKRRRETSVYRINYAMPKTGGPPATLDDAQDRRVFRHKTGGFSVTRPAGDPPTEQEVTGNKSTPGSRERAREAKSTAAAREPADCVDAALQAVAQGATIDQVDGVTRALFERVPAPTRRMGTKVELHSLFREALRAIDVRKVAKRRSA